MSALRYQGSKELRKQRGYWAERENTAKMKKQAIDKILEERQAKREDKNEVVS